MFSPNLIEGQQSFIPYIFHVGFYIVKDTAQSKQEGLSQLEYRFSTSWFCKHDPKFLVLQHASQVSSCCPYTHDKFKYEIFTECAQDWEEVLQRKDNSNMTRFKAMSMDEKGETIEQSAQEDLRVREGIKVAETIEAQRRGFLLLEGAQRVIDQLENDPQIIEMMRIPLDDPITIREETNGSESIRLEEITSLENPRVSLPQIRSSMTIPIQFEIPRTPGETSVPNPLLDLITIYDDEKSSEVSLVTPILITEEKEPEKTSTPSPDASFQNPLQGDHEAETILDTEFLDLSGTPKDSFKEELGSGGKKEEVQQQEIETSTIDHQVSTELITEYSILSDTSPIDEHQTKLKPPKLEVQEPVLEQIHTTGSLGNTLTLGEQQIPEPVDEVADIQVICYDRKRKVVMKRTTKKRRLMLDSSILITMEEKLLST
jgi:hypothetical protein